MTPSTLSLDGATETPTEMPPNHLFILVVDRKQGRMGVAVEATHPFFLRGYGRLGGWHQTPQKFEDCCASRDFSAPTRMIFSQYWKNTFWWVIARGGRMPPDRHLQIYPRSSDARLNDAHPAPVEPTTYE
jgi:hypothetical protein